MNLKSKSRGASPRSLLLLPTFAALSLALACGGDGDDPPVDEATESPSGDDSGSSGGESVTSDAPPVSEGLPLDPNGSASGTSLNLFELLETDECDTGWLPDDPPSADVTCAATFQGACFETDEDACRCAGCADDCAIAESFPTQISCNAVPLGCDYQVFDACYGSADEACAAAGCDVADCVIQESYPMRPSCSG